MLSMAMDITERKQAEQDLKESKSLFEAVVENVPLMIFLKEATDLRFVIFNRAGEELLGYDRKELLGKNNLDLFPPEQAAHFIAKDREVLDGKAGMLDIPEESIETAKKGRRLLHTRKICILGNDGDTKYLLGISEDITERKHAEEEKSRLEAQLRHSQKMEAVGTLAGGVAHDFNNILNVIMGYGSMVYDGIEAGSLAKEQMNEVLIAADRAANLTKRLLVFSRKNVLEVKPVNINALILGMQKMLDRLIREDIDFTVELADRPLIVPADTGLIEQVLMNLATNAKDAMQEGGRLTIGTGVEEINNDYVAAYGYGKPGSYAIITVADTGHGIDAESQKKIFEPFFTTKGIGEGTGLGLAISYGIIKQHGGFINVESKPGHGTEFKIYLPLTEETASPDMKTDAAVPVKGGNETVLVAEDDAPIRTLLSIVLESFGYSVVSAVNGEDAVVKFMENRDKIQLVILDMIMPKKNGKMVGEAIRKVNPGTKILFMSGYTMDIHNTNELAEGGVDFIRKPCPPRDLLIKVREILDK
jgi:PAS domain S-box-containing protein